MNWSLVSAGEHFEKHRNGWDDLNRSRKNHILLDSRFVAPLLKQFGSKDIMLAFNPAADRRGFALLVKVGMTAWNTFQPSQSPLGMILFSYRDDDLEELRDLMRSLPGFAASLSILQQDP